MIDWLILLHWLSRCAVRESAGQCIFYILKENQPTNNLGAHRRMGNARVRTRTVPVLDTQILSMYILITLIITNTKIT